MTDGVPTTSQFQALDPPTAEQRYLCIELACPGCNTARTFRAGVALGRALIAERGTQHIGIETWCETCERQIRLVIFWGSHPRTFQYDSAEMNPRSHGIRDNIGLTERR